MKEKLYWPEPWLYDEQDGVGLLFCGYPEDAHVFINVMAMNGCHPKAATRILERIARNNHDCLTVSPTLHFEEIAYALSELGMYMEIIPPMLGWKQKHDDGFYPQEFLTKFHG